MTSVETMLPFLSRTGTVSVNSVSPLSLQIAVRAASGARKSTNSDIPPSNLNCCLVGFPVLLSTTERTNPGTKKAVCLALSSRSFKSNAVSFTKICGSGQYLTLVPVLFLATLPRILSSLFLANALKGLCGEMDFLSSKTPGSPR